MTAINIKAFRPAIPLSSERSLQANQATEALAVKLRSGAIEPIKGVSLVYTSAAAAIASLTRYRSYAGADYWLESTAAGVDFAKSPVASDAYERIYWTGDGEPRMGRLSSITASAPYPTAAGLFVLGVVRPTNVPTISSVSGGTAPTETRVYSYSFVTAFGEESALSPLSAATVGNANGTWNLASLQTAPPNSGTISAATHSAGVVTVTLNTVVGLRAGEPMVFAAVGGMTDLNGTRNLLSVNTATNQVTVSLTTAQAYTAGGTWTRVAPHNISGMVKRIYRSVGTNVDWHYVAEIAVATTTYADAIASANLGSGPSVLDDGSDHMPPTDGKALVELASGGLAMLSGNQLCLSEREKPHSWPTSYRYAFTGRGIGMAAAGDSVFVGTDNAPLLFNAANPETAGPPVKLAGPQVACLAKAGMVAIDGGALMPSNDGLWMLMPGSTRNLTLELYTPEQWALLAPSTFRAAFINSFYMALRTPVDGSPARIFMLDTAHPDGIVEVVDSFDVLAANPYDGRLYAAKGQKVYKWDEDDSTRYTGTWTSAEFQLEAPVNFARAQVHANFADIQALDTSITAANTALLADIFSVTNPLYGGFGYPFLTQPLGGSSMLEQPAQTARSVVFTLLEAGVVRWSQAVTSSDPFTLPGGFLQEVCTLRITASCKVHSVTIATSTAELKKASGG